MSNLEEDLHLGTLNDDPTGVVDCGDCNGQLVVNGEICPSCQTRQQIRSSWWASGPGPERLRRKLGLI